MVDIIPDIRKAFRREAERMKAHVYDVYEDLDEAKKQFRQLIQLQIEMSELMVKHYKMRIEEFEKALERS